MTLPNASNTFAGSYNPKDVTLLLKNVNGLVPEMTIAEREIAMQTGKSYGHIIPKEELPTAKYMELFKYSLSKYAKQIAKYVAIVSEMVVKERDLDRLILTSIARAGTPVGILIKRYILLKYNVDVPHYTISVLEGIGIDRNAIKYILKNHPKGKIQFVDGWTGKGFVSEVLNRSCGEIELEEGIYLNPSLAVLADPGNCTYLFGTREDFLIPNACLNSTISGLYSRTVYHEDFIGPDDFHGVKFFEELLPHDYSLYYLDAITSHFSGILDYAEFKEALAVDRTPTWAGSQSLESIKTDFGITNPNFIKPGINETTRMLLIRVPWKIIVNDMRNPNLEHILHLAKEKNIEVVEYRDMSYACCGLIKEIM